MRRTRKRKKSDAMDAARYVGDSINNLHQTALNLKAVLEYEIQNGLEAIKNEQARSANLAGKLIDRLDLLLKSATATSLQPAPTPAPEKKRGLGALLKILRGNSKG